MQILEVFGACLRDVQYTPYSFETISYVPLPLLFFSRGRREQGLSQRMTSSLDMLQEAYNGDRKKITLP